MRQRDLVKVPSVESSSSTERQPSLPGTLRFCGYDVPYHPVWKPLIDMPDFQRALALAEALIKPDVVAHVCTPDVPRILRFLEFERVNAIIIGQDPYKQSGFASGYAFEVNGPTTWTELADLCTGSDAAALKTLVRLFYMTATNWCTRYPDVRPTFRKAAKAADDGGFCLLPPHELFGHWRAMGILPLNATLSTRIDRSNAHRKAWTKVRRLIVRYIADTWPDAQWFLWGAAAKKLATSLPAGAVVHRAGHPDLQGVGEESDQFFFKASGIPETWETLKWTGRDQCKRNSVAIAVGQPPDIIKPSTDGTDNAPEPSRPGTRHTARTSRVSG